MGRLEGKVSLVTGATSGIGQAIAIAFAKEGSRVAVAGRDEKRGAEVVAIIKASYGQAEFVKADVSQSSEVQSMVNVAVNRFGKLNVLCNCAGLRDEPHNSIVDLPEEIWDRIINVNLKGVYLCCKYGIPDLIKSGGGSIINIGSISGVIALERSAYSAAKGGVIALTRSLAAQFADDNIRVNVICPGSIDTPGRRAVSTQIARRRFPLPEPLLRRVGTPDEIAPMAVYLASDESSYTTGGIFLVDGGLTAR